MSTTEILRRLLVHSDGRDKSLKIIQYVGKILLWLHLTRKSKAPRKTFFYNLSKLLKVFRPPPSPLFEFSTYAPRIQTMAKEFSNTRKIMRLAHFLEPYTELRKYHKGEINQPPTNDYCDERFIIFYLRWLNCYIGLANDIFDDLYCLGKLNILDKSVAKWAEPIAIRLWFTNIIFDLYDGFYKIRQNLRVNNDYNSRNRGVGGNGSSFILAACAPAIAAVTGVASVPVVDSNNVNNKDNKNYGDGDDNEEEIKRRETLYWLYISFAKLWADLIFCGK